MNNTNCEAEKKRQEASEKAREVEPPGRRGAEGVSPFPEKRKLREFWYDEEQVNRPGRWIPDSAGTPSSPAG
jgi:hypothetical protein